MSFIFTSASATPSRIATCASWPQACITPTFSPRNSVVTVDLNGTSVCSVTGSASMSARSAMVRAGLAALEQRGDAGDADAGFHFQAQRAQFLGDEVRRFDFAIAELGIGMQVTPPFDHVRLDGFGGGIELATCRRAPDVAGKVSARTLQTIFVMRAERCMRASVEDSAVYKPGRGGGIFPACASSP